VENPQDTLNKSLVIDSSKLDDYVKTITNPHPVIIVS